MLLHAQSYCFSWRPGGRSNKGGSRVYLPNPAGSDKKRHGVYVATSGAAKASGPFHLTKHAT